MPVEAATRFSPKRKPAADLSSTERKRAKTKDARTLAVQSSEAALSKTGELDVSAFVAAREFEIRALEAGIRDARRALTSRSFQKLPRNLRRRTASHNVQRVPKRLRARTRREMVEDNTPTVTARRRKPTALLRLRLETARRLQGLNSRTKAQRAKRKEESNSKYTTDPSSHDVDIAPRVPKIKKNKLSHPEKPPSKFKKRQRAKTWLPTHMFHTKRAHMTPPKEPLWRFAIPLTPTEKSYRPTHRASGARGAIAWDMSYMSTIGLEAVEPSIEGLLKALGIEGESAWGPKGRKWRSGTRSLEGWVLERDGQRRPIAPVTLIWCAKKKGEDVEMTDAGARSSKKVKRKMFVRVHPSAFLQLWDETLKAAKIQKPEVMVEDLRFEIGSIDVTGPGAIETLMSALRPTLSADGDEYAKGSPADVWASLSGVTNAASLPQNSLLGFNVYDPRLRFPPRAAKPARSDEDMNKLASILSSWTPDSSQSQPDLFSRPARLQASRLLPNQKAINRRKTLAGPGQFPASKPEDPNIPIIIFTSCSGGLSRDTTSQGTWTVLLPWKCVLPVWYSIIYCPLSSGSQPRFGGVKEKQQLSFERGEPWFPGDYPGTRAGWEWEIRQREKLKLEWERKPKGKRIEYDSLDLGNGKKGEVGDGWACDWERLVLQSQDSSLDSQAQNTNAGNDLKLSVRQKWDRGKKDKPSTPDGAFLPPPGLHHLPSTTASTVLGRKYKPGLLPSSMQNLLSQPALATVKVTILHRGTPADRARIYRLPTNNPKLREQWMSLLCNSSSSKKPNTNKQEQNTSTTSAADTIADSDPDSQLLHLPIPTEEDLIGFVTAGNFNLSAGKGTGIGSILIDRVGLYTPPASQSSSDANSQKTGATSKATGFGKEKLMRTCIIRCAGERIGRVGFWEVV